MADRATGTSRRTRPRRVSLRVWAAAVVCSLALHVLFTLLGARIWEMHAFPPVDDSEPSSDRVTELLLVEEAGAPRDVQDMERPDNSTADPTAAPIVPAAAATETPVPLVEVETEPLSVPEDPEPPPTPDDEPPPPTPPEVPENAPSVAQPESNDERAPDARFLAERDNRVEEESRAAQTSLDAPAVTPELAAGEREEGPTVSTPRELDPELGSDSEDPPDAEPEEAEVSETESDIEEPEPDAAQPDENAEAEPGELEPDDVAPDRSEPSEEESRVDPLEPSGGPPVEDERVARLDRPESRTADVETAEPPAPPEEPALAVDEDPPAVPRQDPRNDEPVVPPRAEEDGEPVEQDETPGSDAAVPEPTDSTPSSASTGLRGVTVAGAFDRAEAAMEGQTSPTAIARVGAMDGATYREVFSERDRRDQERARRRERESTLGGDVQGRWDRTRAAMENFDVDVRTGTETHLSTTASPFAGYIHALHNRIHPRWSGYLFWLDRSWGPGSVLANPELVVTLEYVLMADGSVDRVRIVRTSGEGVFDGEAVNMLWEIGPHAPPPTDMLSYDGKVRIHWSFHRDARMCGTFGASVRFLEPPAE